MQQNDVRNYINGIEYKGLNNVLDRFPTTEGAVVLQSDGTTYQYEYTIKDHLGNVRVTYSDANNDGFVGVTDIKQVNHFYPYGLNMEGNWNGSFAEAKNKYQYNNREWNDDFGLGWNHHDWRFYDPAISRFVTVDSEGESGGQVSISPYHFSYDNPIRFSDPNGLEGEGCCGAATQASAQVTGNVIGFADNLLGSSFRESLGNHLFGDGSLRGSFDKGVHAADQGSLVIGGVVAGVGLVETAIGGGLVLSGVGAAKGVGVAAEGLAKMALGTWIANNANQNLQNSQVKAKENRRSGKEHTSGARPSTENKHQEGASRKAKEQKTADAKYAKTKSTKEAKSNNQKKKEDPDYKRPGPKLKK